MATRTLRILGDRSCCKSVPYIGTSSFSSSKRGWTASPTSRGFGTSSIQTNDSRNNNNKKNDRLLVVGSGVAGSAAALVAAETYQIPVTMLFAGSVPKDCNSWWAQGGIIYRNFDPESGDSADSLANDIHRAGAGLCADNAVRKVSEEGPDRVKELLLNAKKAFANVPFDKTPNGDLSLCLGEFLVSF
jgi:L-aspartate oxidase